MARDPLRARRPPARPRGAERSRSSPAAETLDRLRAWSGADVLLPERNGAQRQRALIDAGASPAEVSRRASGRPNRTYSEETAS